MNTRTIRTLIMALATLIATFAQPIHNERHHRHYINWHAVSQIALITAHSVDVAVSYGQPELNPTLRSANGTFNTRSIALKSAIVASWLTTDMLLCRTKWGRDDPTIRRTFTTVNFILVGGYSALTIRNIGLRRPPK